MKKDKIVISGINGFVGHHLARELHSIGVSIIGVGREKSINTEISDIVSEYHQADIIQAWPDIPQAKAIIHLAGLAAVGPSFESPQLYINANSAMVTNLCEYYLKQVDKPRIILISSGAIYDSNQTLPISENGKIGFFSPYAVSKVLNENQANYYRNRGLDIIVARPFNHIGVGQNKGFILPDFYDRLSSLKVNEKTIITGNIETRRDYTDVRDIVRAYRQLALEPNLKHNTYNICSGKSIAGSEIFNILKNIMNLKDVEYKIDPSLVRPTDAKNIIGDASRLKEDLDWDPQIDIQQTIVDFVKSKV